MVATPSQAISIGTGLVAVMKSGEAEVGVGVGVGVLNWSGCRGVIRGRGRGVRRGRGTR